jgi:primosomal protein N' (replication factor Y)
VVFVLNRTGRARLLACCSCGELARCEACGAATVQAGVAAADGAAQLDCPRCGLRRPLVCARCGSTALAIVRAGTTRAREELEALTGLPTEEVTATSKGPAERSDGLQPLAIVGTEAALHRARAASLVVFLDLDQELLAPRLRAAEETLSLLALAARLVGGRRRAGRLVVQTRLPDHEVIAAAMRADPGLLAAAELVRRAELRLPPVSAVARVEGGGVEAFAEALDGHPVEVAGTGPEQLLVRAPDHDTLCTALAAVAASTDAVRVEVDPLRL